MGPLRRLLSNIVVVLPNCKFFFDLPRCEILFQGENSRKWMNQASKTTRTVLKKTIVKIFGIFRYLQDHYIPGADPCILCLCENGKKFYCQAVRCAASEDCLFYTTGKSCCEFICMDKAVEVLCGFCLISLLLLIILIYYLRKRKQK